jgi:hypothetical protein
MAYWNLQLKAFCLIEPGVRFIDFEIAATGVSSSLSVP